MQETPLKVTAYAGFRGEESPRAFLLNNANIEVRTVLDRWTEEMAETGERRRCFRVKGSDFRTHTLCYHEGTMAWVYRR